MAGFSLTAVLQAELEVGSSGGQLRPMEVSSTVGKEDCGQTKGVRLAQLKNHRYRGFTPHPTPAWAIVGN